MRLFRCQALCLGLRVVAVTALALRCFPGLAREIDYFAGSLPTLITLAAPWPALANAIAPEGISAFVFNFVDWRQS